MARKGRVTTSVSTLVTNVHDLLVYAKVNKRMDLGKAVYDLHVRTTALAKEYAAIRSQIDPLLKAFLPKVDADTDFSMFEEVAEVAEVEATEENTTPDNVEVVA
jgi:hypothetical protein